MGSRLLNSNESALCMKDLKDGQIAVIIDTCNYTGRLIQRYKSNCVAIGKHSGNGFSGIELNTLAVRLLKDGELIEIFNNQ